VCSARSIRRVLSALAVLLFLFLAVLVVGPTFGRAEVRLVSSGAVKGPGSRWGDRLFFFSYVRELESFTTGDILKDSSELVRSHSVQTFRNPFAARFSWFIGQRGVGRPVRRPILSSNFLGISTPGAVEVRIGPDYLMEVLVSRRCSRQIEVWESYPLLHLTDSESDELVAHLQTVPIDETVRSYYHRSEALARMRKLLRVMEAAPC
jgi:hypothetical protein